MIDLRPYQREASEAVISKWEGGQKRQLLVLPTGTGKTVVFSDIANKRTEKGRTLIVAHRDELLEQARDKLFKVTGRKSALEKAKESCIDSDLAIAVGSVQSLGRTNRLERFPHDYFKTIIVDEAHHALADNYQRMLRWFPDADVLGVTATPDRGDRQDLGKYFDGIAYEYSMQQAIKDGYLVPIHAQMIPLNLDISNVGVRAGDFASDELDSALEPYLEQIADEMMLYCCGRKTVVFLPLISTSQKFLGILLKKGFKAAEVNGQSEDRAQILADFDAGKYDILCNSMLLTEGWDCPSVDCVIVLRPTKCRALYQQMVGRGTRPCEGKKDLLILDFLWMTAKHDLCKPASLMAKKEDIAERMNQMLEDGEELDLTDLELDATKDIQKEREAALAKQLAMQRSKKKGLVDPIQYAFSILDEDLQDYVPEFAWQMGPPSQKQIDAIEKMGIDASRIRNMGEASLILDRLINRSKIGLSTPKQIRFLESRGFVGVGSWPYSAAHTMIGRIANNRWQVPIGIVPATYTPTA